MSRPSFFSHLALSCALFTHLLAAGPATAVALSPGQTDVEPISITAKSMTAGNTDHRVIFEGDVVLKKGEFVLKTDRLEVTLAEADPSSLGTGQEPPVLEGLGKGPQSISKIEAIGNVRVEQGERRGRADRAIYDQNAEKVILLGQPEVWSQEYRVSGTRMIFYLKEQRNVVEDSEAVVFPK